MSRKRKPSAEAANLTQNQILKELKKAFSLDNSVINILKKLYSPTAIKKSFNAGKTATQKMVNQAKEAVKTGKPGTSRAKVVRASIAKPAATIVQGRPGNSAQGFASIQSQLVKATIVSSPPNRISLINSIKKVMKAVKFLLICKTNGLVLNS